jgi:hypothetical protein
MERERAQRSEPPERSEAAACRAVARKSGGGKRRASDGAGESEGRRPSGKIETRLLILWFALAFVVWNGVYDMRMHDTVRGYLLETAEARAGLSRGVDMRQYLHRGFIDALAFSTAWSLGVFLAGIVTMRTYRAHLMPRAHPEHPSHPEHP